MKPTTVMFETGAATDAGKVRQQNEDSHIVLPESGLFAVSDGMGGHESGALASGLVTAALQSIGSPVSAADLLARLEDRVLRANTRVQEVARERGGVVMGATLAVLLIYDTHYACVWSGDSRVYLVRGGTIAQLSRDHTEVQELVDRGVLTKEEARTWPRRNVITRAIGVHEEPELELEHGTLEPDDLFILCSDGLTSHVDDKEIQGCVAGRSCQEACDCLVGLTLERGASDNVTVVAVRYRPPAEGTVLRHSDRQVLPEMQA
jgi:serine/threonine protein phosphatase PrpC